MKHFDFTLRTPDQTLFAGKALTVTLSTEEGEMEIMANHASLTAAVLFTPVKITEDNGKEETYLARNGIASFDNAENSASLLTFHCEKRSEISLRTAQEYLAFILEKLAKHEDLSGFQISHLEGEKIAVEEQIKQAR